MAKRQLEASSKHVVGSKGKSKKLKKNKVDERNGQCENVEVESVNAEPRVPKQKKKMKMDEHSGKRGKKPNTKEIKVHKKEDEIVDEEALYLSSGEEDASVGMGKWLNEYRESRVNLDSLQQQIDAFLMEHDRKMEAERKEREEKAEEEGWTVVKRQKGNKKSKEEGSGLSVESASKAAAEMQMSIKKPKEVGNFYRFQKREAQMNEILTLQSKFEQDKIRIQQLRASRKFRPY